MIHGNRNRRAGAQLPSHAPGRRQRPGRSQPSLFPGRHLPPALHPAPPLARSAGAPPARRGVVLVHPRHQPGSAALDVADHEAAALLHRPRDVQRHRVHHQGGEAGGDLLWRVRAGQHLHRGRGRQRPELLAETLRRRAAGRPRRQGRAAARRPGPVPGRRHLLRLLGRRQPGAVQVHGPGRLDLRGPAHAARAAGRRPGRGHLLRQPVPARRPLDALVHQPPARLPVLPR